jgi:hypothetical protein
MSGLLRIALSFAVLGLALGCTTGKAQQMKEQPAASALPQTDPALGDNVQHKLVATSLEQVSARVAPFSAKPSQVAILAPELTPAQAEQARAAFPQVSWRPSEGGKPTATVTIGK